MCSFSDLIESLTGYIRSWNPNRRDPGSLFRLGWDFYPYFRHDYNSTWTNERAVEVPVVMQFYRRHSSRGTEEILEVGNVLSHYYQFRHDVVDKYEASEGVLNCDVIDYNPGKKYDLILSISTLEHVGWDEEVKDPEKILLAISHIQSLLKTGGRLIVTLPLGYNPPMDEMIVSGKIRFPVQYYLKRVSTANMWKQVGAEDVIGIKYGEPFPFANGLVIGSYTRKK